MQLNIFAGFAECSFKVEEIVYWWEYLEVEDRV